MSEHFELPLSSPDGKHIIDKSKKLVAIVKGKSVAPFFDENTKNRTEFFIRAVNAHEELAQALVWAKLELEFLEAKHGVEVNANKMRRIDAALALARGDAS